MRKPDPRPNDEILRDMYIDRGMSTLKIGQHFGKSYSTARRWLLEAGIPIRPASSKTVYGEAQKRWPGDDMLRQMYTGRGMTLRAMAAELDVGYGKTREWVIKAGIPLRHDNSRRYPIEPLLDFLSKPSENLWYFLGYFYADGSMEAGRPRISISSVDKAHLAHIFAATGYTGKVLTQLREHRPIHTIKAHGETVYNMLAGFGLAPNKSKSIRLPSVPDKFFGDFVRGYFDGDGCIIVRTQAPQSMCFNIKIASGSRLFIQDLQSTLAKHGIAPTHIYQQGSTWGTVFTLNAGAQAPLLALTKLMYSHSPTLYMERKWRRFAMFLSYIGTVHPDILT